MQDFKSLSDHFGTFWIKRLKYHFQKIIESLRIDQPLFDVSDSLVLIAIENFFQHFNILKIKQATNTSGCFSLKLVTMEDILMEVIAWGTSKGNQDDIISTKIIKTNCDIFTNFFQWNFNNVTEALKQVFFQSN